MGSSRRDALGAWVLASRPKTLVASVVPVAVGSALAYRDTGVVPTSLFTLALLFSVLIQIGTNFSNDYFDDLRGADSKRALGPQRAVSSGLIPEKTMLVASLVILLLAFVIYMKGPFQFLLEDIYNQERVGYFAQGALFWKFMKDGVMIAFYPVFGEVVFFYLLYQDLQKEIAESEAVSDIAQVEDGVGSDMGMLPDPESEAPTEEITRSS